MLIGLAVSLLAVIWVVGVTALGLWAGGWVPALLLGGFSAYVMRSVVFAAWLAADPGSIRRAKGALRQAQREGNPWAVGSARARLALVRWHRRS